MNLTGFYKIVTKLEGKKRAEAKWEALQEVEAQRQVKIETSKSWFFFSSHHSLLFVQIAFASAVAVDAPTLLDVPK